MTKPYDLIKIVSAPESMKHHVDNIGTVRRVLADGGVIVTLAPGTDHSLHASEFELAK